MVESKEVKERRQLIHEKEKEVRQLQKEEARSWWRAYRIRVYYALERLLLVVVSLTVFILHCVNHPEEGSSRSNSLVDRALTPMAFGGDAMVQLGLFIACAAYLYAHPAMLLVIDTVTGMLIFIHICFTWQSSATGLALAIFLLSILDLLLHTVMVVKAVLKLRHHRKRRSTIGSQGRLSEPEGWSWVGTPRFSSSTWSRKGGPSIASTRDSARSLSQTTRASEGQAEAKRPTSKKSLLTQAQERWDKEVKEKQEKEKEKDKEKSLTWLEKKQDTPKSSLKDMAASKASSRDTARVASSSRTLESQQPSKHFGSSSSSGSQSRDDKPKPKKG